MRHLKQYKQFEGLGSWVRGKFNSDEKTAEGILKEMDKLKESDLVEINPEQVGTCQEQGDRQVISFCIYIQRLNDILNNV
jgi:hypothetical protein